jgi:hypothetical protein
MYKVIEEILVGAITPGVNVGIAVFLKNLGCGSTKKQFEHCVAVYSCMMSG